MRLQGSGAGAALGLRGDGARDERRRGGGGAIGVGQNRSLEGLRNTENKCVSNGLDSPARHQFTRYPNLACE